MKDIRYRYQNDAVFHNMVNVLRNAIRELMLTPSEVREAAMLACIIEEERKPRAPLTTSDDEVNRMRDGLRIHVHHWIPYEPTSSVGDESDLNWQCAVSGCSARKR